VVIDRWPAASPIEAPSIAMARKTLHCPAAKLREGDQCPQSTCPVRVRRMRLLRKNRRSEYGALGRVIILWRAIARIQGPSGASSSQTLPFEVNGEQRFLHNILGILIALSGSSQAAARQAAKDKGQLQQQFPVSMSKAHWFSWLSAPTRCPLSPIRPVRPLRYLSYPPSLSGFSHHGYARPM
jgi:hypothetical protein